MEFLKDFSEERIAQVMGYLNSGIRVIEGNRTFYRLLDDDDDTKILIKNKAYRTAKEYLDENSDKYPNVSLDNDEEVLDFLAQIVNDGLWKEDPTSIFFMDDDDDPFVTSVKESKLKRILADTPIKIIEGPGEFYLDEEDDETLTINARYRVLKKLVEKYEKTYSFPKIETDQDVNSYFYDFPGLVEGKVTLEELEDMEKADRASNDPIVHRVNDPSMAYPQPKKD